MPASVRISAISSPTRITEYRSSSVRSASDSGYSKPASMVYASLECVCTIRTAGPSCEMESAEGRVSSACLSGR